MRAVRILTGPLSKEEAQKMCRGGFLGDRLAWGISPGARESAARRFLVEWASFSGHGSCSWRLIFHGPHLLAQSYRKAGALCRFYDKLLNEPLSHRTELSQCSARTTSWRSIPWGGLLYILLHCYLLAQLCRESGAWRSFLGQVLNGPPSPNGEMQKRHKQINELGGPSCRSTASVRFP